MIKITFKNDYRLKMPILGCRKTAHHLTCKKNRIGLDNFLGLHARNQHRSSFSLMRKLPRGSRLWKRLFKRFYLFKYHRASAIVFMQCFFPCNSPTSTIFIGTFPTFKTFTYTPCWFSIPSPTPKYEPLETLTAFLYGSLEVKIDITIAVVLINKLSNEKSP